jgi:hypothetical protein
MTVTSNLEWNRTHWVVVLKDSESDVVIRLPLRDWLNLKMVQYAVVLAGEPIV